MERFMDDMPAMRGFTEPQELPPNNLEAEQALLGAMLVNNDAALKVTGFLKAEHFYEPVHGRIYEAVLKLIEKNQIADPVKLKPYFEYDESLRDVGGAQYLVRLSASAASIINAQEYGQTIKDLADRRTLILIAETLKEQAQNADIDTTAESLIEQAEANLHEIRDTGFERNKEMRSSAEVVRSAMERFKQAADRGGIVGLPTGFNELDKHFSLSPSEMTVLAGRPSMGKSALANFMTYAASCGMGVHEPVGAIFFSKEMDGEDNIARRLSTVIYSIHGRVVPYFRIRRGQLQAAEWAMMREAAELLSRANVIWVDTARLTPARILSFCELGRRQFERKGIPLGLITLDYLQQIRTDNKKDGAYEQTREASNFGVEVCKQYRIPGLFLSQLSRNVEQRIDKRPMMSDLRDAGTIEQDAANILFAFREEYYLEKGIQTAADQDIKYRLGQVAGTTEIIIGKNRNGPLETVRVISNMAANYFEDMPA